MRIRLSGTPTECAATAEVIGQVLDVLSESAPLPNRGSSRLVRVYLDVRILAEGREGVTGNGAGA